MTWLDEANKRDPIESAKKYIEMMKEFDEMDSDIVGENVHALYMIELDILWEAANRDEKAVKILKQI